MATSFYGNIQEAELKNKVAADWFATYDSTPVIGNIDFAVAVPTHGPQLFEPNTCSGRKPRRAHRTT